MFNIWGLSAGNKLIPGVSTATSPPQERQKQRNVLSPTMIRNSQTKTLRGSLQQTPQRVGQKTGALRGPLRLTALSVRTRRGAQEKPYSLKPVLRRHGLRKQLLVQPQALWLNPKH